MKGVVWTAVCAAVCALMALIFVTSVFFADTEGMVTFAKVLVGAGIVFAILSLREDR